MTMNSFGCVEAGIVELFTTGGYTPTVAELGGTAVVDRAIASATDQVIEAMPPEVFTQLTQVDFQFLELRALAGQLTVTTSFAPVLAGKTYVWAGQPRFFKEKPYKKTDLLTDDQFLDDSLYRPLAELVEGVLDTDYTIDAMTHVITWITTTADYAIDIATGIITFREALEKSDQVLANYMPDVDDAAFVVDSLANCIADGAAYLLGTRLYPRGSSQWQYIDTLSEQFTAKLAALQAKTWIPPELRLLTYWKPLIPTDGAESNIRSGRVFRG